MMKGRRKRRPLPSGLQIQPAGALADGGDFRASQIAQRQQQVGGRLLVFHLQVAVALQLPVRAAHQQHRRIVAIVRVAVAHAGAEVDHRAVEQRRVAVLRLLQLADEFRQLRHVIRRQLRVFGNALGRVAVVRDRMVRLGEADVRIAAAGALVADHEREHPREVRLEGEQHQIVGHGQAIVDVVRQAERRDRAFGHVRRRHVYATRHETELKNTQCRSQCASLHLPRQSRVSCFLIGSNGRWCVKLSVSVLSKTSE